MLTAFFTTLVQMIRIMLFLVVGFCLNRLRVLSEGAGTGISGLVTTVFLPAMPIHSNIQSGRCGSIRQIGAFGLFPLDPGDHTLPVDC